MKDAVPEMQKHAEELASRKHVVVVGAGAVGIEYAAEIKHYYPDINVTLLHSQTLPLTAIYPESFRKTLLQKLEAIGVSFINEEKVPDIHKVSQQHKPGTPLTLVSGRELPSVDQIIPTIGPFELNSGFISVAKAPKSGLIRVLPTFQLDEPGWHHVFAIGDVARIEGFDKEARQLAKYDKHAAIAVKNVLQLIRDEKATLQQYSGQTEMIVIPIGENDGAGYIGYMGGMQLPTFAVRMIKSKDLFRERILGKFLA